MPATEELDPFAPASGQRHWRVRVVGKNQVEDLVLAESKAASVGTHPSNDLVLGDPTVSRFHCELAVDAKGVRLRDLGSRNGTWVDGLEVHDAYLRDGSLVRIGSTSLSFELGELRLPPPISRRCEFGGLAGHSPAMRGAIALLERASASEATVLIEGETGTGKERAAEALHRASTRASGRFIVVDCGALPAELLDSELFGHERGSFTGAANSRIGAFEEASGGTVFLDEVGELPLSLQPKLLRALESKQVRRVGTNLHVEVDVRVVAATNRDLRHDVNVGRFRADLYYRLAVLTVRLPPLRERPDDIDILAPRLLAALGATPELIARFLCPQRLSRLKRAAWPGNVRELRNQLERWLAFDSSGEPVGALHGPGEVGRVPYAISRQRALDLWERQYIADALAAAGGNVERAARLASLGRAHMYRLARRHDLVRRPRSPRRHP